MTKKVIAIALALALAALSFGCGGAHAGDKVDIIQNGEMHVYVDNETGVEYLLYTKGSGASTTACMAPRLNADGSVKVKE